MGRDNTRVPDEDVEPSGIYVAYNDAPVHCVDVSNKGRCRFLRIRPRDGGAIFEGTDNVHSCFLTAQELRQLASALDNLANAADANRVTAQDFE